MISAASASRSISELGAASTNSGEIFQYSAARMRTSATVARELVSKAMRLARSISLLALKQRLAHFVLRRHGHIGQYASVIPMPASL